MKLVIMLPNQGDFEGDGTDPNVADADDNNNGVPDRADARRMRAVGTLPTIYQLLLNEQEED